jgi:predicted nucleotidyltransferase
VHFSLDRKRAEVRELCQRYYVVRLDVFGSAARGRDFDGAASDIDFLVEFEPVHDDLARFLAFLDALEALLGRTVDLVDRNEIVANRNYIRQRVVLTEAQTFYVA